jgi:hypothetical protein
VFATWRKFLRHRATGGTPDSFMSSTYSCCPNQFHFPLPASPNENQNQCSCDIGGLGKCQYARRCVISSYQRMVQIIDIANVMCRVEGNKYVYFRWLEMKSMNLKGFICGGCEEALAIWRERDRVDHFRVVRKCRRQQACLRIIDFNYRGVPILMRRYPLPIR